MSLTDEARKDMIRPGPPCAVCILPKDLREEVEKSLLDVTIRRASLARVLTARGYRITRHTLGHHHREGHCGKVPR